ncbi:MAG: hypothetical protein ACRCXG_06140 [Vibrio sp.]
MPITELQQIIERFKNRKDDTPITLNDTTSRVFALHELLSICENELYLFVFFDEHGESDLFEMLSDEKIGRKISRHLDHGDIHLLTNNTQNVKDVHFYDRLSESALKRLHVKPIPKKLADEYQQSRIDNEFVLASPEHLIFLGRYANGTERLSETRAFLNLYEKSFYNTLVKFFNLSIERAEKREFQ